MSQVWADKDKMRVVNSEPLEDKQWPAEINGIESVSESVGISPFPGHINTSIDKVVSDLSSLIELVWVD